MSEWIKVEERLPKDGLCVIGSGWIYGEKVNGRWVEPTIYSEEDRDFHPLAMDEEGDLVADFDASMIPTHWQLLPSPPSEDQP